MLNGGGVTVQCVICGCDTSDLPRSGQRRICDKPECKRELKKRYDADYRKKHQPKIRLREEKFRQDHAKDLRKYYRDYHAVHGPHNTCQWCRAKKSDFLDIQKIKGRNLWLCEICALIWSVETRRENEKKPARKKKRKGYRRKWYWNKRKKLGCAIPGCKKKKGLIKIKDGRYLCARHRADRKAHLQRDRRAVKKDTTLTSFKEEARAIDLKNYEPVCDLCGRRVYRYKKRFFDEQSGKYLLLCKSCQKLKTEEQENRSCH